MAKQRKAVKAAKPIKAAKTVKKDKAPRTIAVDLRDPQHADKIKRNASGISTWFAVMDGTIWCQDKENPGVWMYAELSGLPAGTSVASAWATEVSNGVSLAGDARFYTYQVQLYNNGTQCRVGVGVTWLGHQNAQLPWAVQLMWA